MSTLWLLLASLGPFAQSWDGPLEIPQPSATEGAECREVQSSSYASSPARIVSAAPVVLPLIDDGASAASCSRPLPALTEPDVSSGGDITFDLDLRSVDLKASSRPGSSERYAMPERSALPADTSDHELLVASGCGEQRTPLDSIEPAHVPAVALALVPDGQAGAVAARNNAVLLRELALPAIGRSLAVLGGDAGSLLAGLLLDPDVEAAQRDHVYRTSGAVAADPLAALNYAPARLQLQPLRAQASGRGVSVAVIDTGVDVNHPDLLGRDIRVLNTVESDFVAEAHGTAVAGLIAATSGNGEGSFGLAPDVSVLAVRACAAKAPGALAARCRTSTLAPALQAAIDADVDVINLSLTGPPDPLLARLIEEARRAGVFVIAAAGNGGPLARPAFPAALPGVLAVTATDATDDLYVAANLGRYVDLAAPGVDVVAPGLNAGYPSVSGTSFATAHATAVVALLLELGADADPAKLSELLTEAVVDLGDAGRDERFGNGLLSACAAGARINPDLTCVDPEQP